MSGKYYSRKVQTEKRRNQRRAFRMILFTVLVMVAFFFWGLPTIIKVAGLVGDIRNSSTPITSNDTTPPAPPRLDDLPNATKDSTIDVNGSAEAGSTVVLLLGNEIKETIVGATGRFSHTYDLKDGDNRISAYAKDTSGNQSDNSQTVVVVYDTKPPEISIDKPSNGQKFYGSENKVSVEGTTDSDSRVSINESFAVVNSAGKFSRVVTLNEGVNEITIKAQDNADNVTEQKIIVEYLK